MGKLSQESITNASRQFAWMRRKIRAGEPFAEGPERDAVLEVMDNLEEMTRDYLEVAMLLEKFNERRRTR